MDKELRIWMICIVSILIVALITVIYVLIKNYKFQKTFSLGKLAMNGSVYVDEETNKKTLSIVIANKTINPINIVSTGLVYNLQKINLIEHVYQKKPKDNITIATIDSRNSIMYTYDYMTIFEYVTKYKKIKEIYLYAIDSLGTETIVKFDNIRKIIKFDLKLKKKGIDINTNFEAVLGKNKDEHEDENHEESNEENVVYEEVYEEVYEDENGNPIEKDEPFELYRDDNQYENDEEETNVDETVDDSNNIF
ncbi:MAG: hypothetical protein K6E20_04705 [Acholeplasmatales bacterium]|nr:hypothetical protein [Acholeplasmatales bacterium]